MFKAKLIDSPNYYGYRKRGFIYFILGALPLGIWVNYDTFPLWASILSILLYIGLLFLTVKNQKRMKSVSGNSQIELDGNILRVKRSKGQQGYEMNLDKAEKISIPRDYGLPKESIMDPDEVSMHPKKNFIEISTGDQKQKFEFIIDSHFMLTQFEKLIQSWTKKGYAIEFI